MKRKGKKKNKGFLLVVGFILIILGISMVATNFSVAGSTLGDTYYEERCVDVQQYLDDGWNSAGTDENGCLLVERDYATASQLINIECGNRYANRWCEDNLGSDAWRSDGCGKREGNSKFWVKCSVFAHEKKGGLERVENTCDYDQNDLLAAETFAGGQTITKTDLRYPIKAFCRGHPAIITDDALKESRTSTDVQEKLINGNSVTIGVDETITVFYIIENNYQLPTICDSGDNLALDVESGLCKSTLGFTYLCSEGQYDALTGTCVVQPESKTICEKGRYDVNEEACVYNPPLQVDCGSNDLFYSVDRDVCVGYAQEEFYCAEGLDLYIPSKEECSGIDGTWLLCPQCPTDKVCPDTICQPRCDEGVACVWTSTLKSDCEDELTNAGYCTIDNETIRICPENMDYNKNNGYCEIVAEERVAACADGSQPVKNSLTGRYECFVEAEEFHDCADGYVYDSDEGACMPEITFYDPAKDAFDDLTVQQYESVRTIETENKGIDYRFITAVLLIFIGIVIAVLGIKK